MLQFSCILLIDEDEVSNHIHEQLFRRLNLSKNFMIAKNGVEGFNFIKYFYQQNNSCPELLFISQNAAIEDRGNFLELFHGLEIRDKNMKIIVMKSQGRNSDKRIPLQSELNISEMIDKPITHQKIESVLHLQKKD